MKRRGPSNTTQILIGLVLGVFVGYLWPSSDVNGVHVAGFAEQVKPLADVFLRMIKMIIAPLLFSTLVVGIAGTGDMKTMGRIGLKAIIYFEVATTIALFLGLFIVNFFQPGVGVQAPGMSVESLKQKLKEKIETSQRALKERQKALVMKKAVDAIVELQSYGVAATADKYLEQIKQEVAESKAAVEVATGAIDTKSIERERTARKVKAAGILQQFEMEMGISKPTAVPDATKAPSVGGRVGEKQGS